MAASVLYRNLWGTSKRGDLVNSLNAADFDGQYTTANPTDANKFALRPGDGSDFYLTWTSLTSLAGIRPFNGPVERRAHALIADDPEVLERRMSAYFDPEVDDTEVSELHPALMMTGNRIVGPAARKKLQREAHFEGTRIKRFPFKPFDLRWCYLANIRPLFSEPSPDLIDQAEIAGNQFFITRDTADKGNEGPPLAMAPFVVDYDFLSGHARLVPVRVWSDGNGTLLSRRPARNASANYSVVANLSSPARGWLAALGMPDPDSDRDIAALPWHHALAIGYAPAWLEENADGIRQDWPRVPLPNTADLLRASAALGARVAALLDPDTPVPGVTTGVIQPTLVDIAVPTKRGGVAMTEADRTLTAGWGHTGKGGAVMPGRGSVVTRDYTPTEATAQAEAALLGVRTHDVFLNADAYWRNIPETVWSFTIGGYQVLKKWLSYREQPLLGRALTPGEVRYVRDVARRLAALRLMAPELDANYRACACAHRPLDTPTPAPDAEATVP